MKKLLLLSFIILISCADKLSYRLKPLNKKQTAITFKTSTIEVDNELLDYVLEFIIEANKHDVDVELISKSYLGIYCDKIPYGTVGVTSKDTIENTYSLIDCKSIQSNNRLRIIVFHEMSHKYVTWGHCHTLCNQIMTSTINNKAIYGNWEKQKEILFTNGVHEGFNLEIDKK